MSTSENTAKATTNMGFLGRVLAILRNSELLIRIACVLGLIALPLMVWSLFDPRVWPVLLALSIGQVIGTTSFLLFLIVVLRDLNVARKLKRSTGASGASLPPAPSSASPVEK